MLITCQFPTWQSLACSSSECRNWRWRERPTDVRVDRKQTIRCTKASCRYLPSESICSKCSQKLVAMATFFRTSTSVMMSSLDSLIPKIYLYNQTASCYQSKLYRFKVYLPHPTQQGHSRFLRKPEMWANAQRDGSRRPAEYRRRPLFNVANLADAHY